MFIAYENGRYWVWPWNKFIKFPRTLQTIAFSNRSSQAGPLQTRTAEGLGLTLYVSFQYKLDPDNLENLYMINMMTYESTFIKIARNVILSTAGQFPATDYWERRQAIVDSFSYELNKTLNQAFASVTYLQLLEITLPEAYEQSIINTQVEIQKKTMMEYEQQATRIRSNISVLTSAINAQIIGINAAASGEAWNMTQKAQASAYTRTIGAEMEAYYKLQQV